MYFKEEKILLAAIDHGFSSIKTPHFIFDNGVRKLGSATTLQENTLEYGNECYKTGEGRLPLKDDKTADKDFLLLTFAAIAKEAQYYGLTDGRELDVVIAAGLPFTRFGNEKNSFYDYLHRGRETFRYEGQIYRINIVEVFLFPQCYAAVANILGKLSPNQLIVDIGSKTIDIIKTKNYVPVERSCTTIPEALIHCMAEINNAVYRRCNKRISEADIQQMMMTGKSLLPDSITTVIRDELKVFAENVEAQLKENGYDPELTPTVYVGGGASVMRLFGNIRGVHICYQEDVRANAIGYEYLALQKKDRWLHE